MYCNTSTPEETKLCEHLQYTEVLFVSLFQCLGILKYDCVASRYYY